MISNVFWIGKINVIGGVETFIYELAKAFKDYDLVIYYNNIPNVQLKRLRKYVRCIKYHGEKIKCKRFFCNYDISIIDNVESEEYIEIVHAVFKYNKLKPHTHPKITKYYAVGKEAMESFKEITGLECGLLHNPLEIEKTRKVLRLISATRIAVDKGDIVKRMQILANELDINGIPYIWIIFTNGEHLVRGKNVVYMDSRLDVRDYIKDSDYLVQLSDTEAFCYSVLESLYMQIPVIVTPIPCFKEMGIENGKNGYILDFDMKNIPIEKIYNDIPKFEYQPLKNEWEDKIIKVKSNYEEERKMKVKVRALINFTDLEENVKRIAKESEWECEKERADFLLEHNAIEVLGEVKEPVVIVDTKEESEIVKPLDKESFEEVKKSYEEVLKPKKRKKKVEK